MKTLYLCGAGNPEGIRLAEVVNRSENRWDRIVVLDDDAGKHGRWILGAEIIGPFSILEQADRDSSEFSNMVARTTVKRAAAFRKLRSYGIPVATLIDPTVDITGVEFEQGVTIYQNVSFCAAARVDAGSVVFTGAVIGHGCHMGRGVVVAPGAVINARVEMEEGVYLGTNASILPDLKIGKWATIGANSAVVQNVPPKATVMGVPAQILMTEPLETDTPEPATAPRLDTPDKAPAVPASPALDDLRAAQREFLDARRAVASSL